MSNTLRRALPRSLSLPIVVALALVGCAAPVTQRVAIDSGARAREEQIQKALAIQEMARMEARLWTVGYAVLHGASTDCGEKVRLSLGFAALSHNRVPPAIRDVTAEALGLGPLPKVVAVYRGSAAEVAGMQVGDILPDPNSPALSRENETAEAARQRLSSPLELIVQRNGTPVALTMQADVVCDYPLRVVQQAEVNAFADGKSIMVSRGMMRFAADDRELALVIGHELGHNVMGHLAKKKQNSLLGAVFDIAAAAYGVNTKGAFSKTGANAYSQDFEAEADYVGMYYLARAGYQTAGAANFWRRMATEHPASIQANHAASHPATPERFLALEHVSSEIQTKKDSGAELVPARTK